MAVSIRNLKQHGGETVTVRGWLADHRRSGEVVILEIRDGSGYVQAVVHRDGVSEEAWQSSLEATCESTVRVTGIARLDEAAPSGLEIQVTDFAVRQLTAGYPIPREGPGPDFLIEHRHLWLRQRGQRAVLTLRHEVCQAIRDFFYEREFVLVDSPILTPTSSEGTSTLFTTDYYDAKAYLSQSGQLYLEPACAAFGKVYCMGPTFRAEPSSTRRHLTEFWMVEPEVAFLDFEGLLRLAEELVCYLVARVLERCGGELETLRRDTAKLEKVTGGFPRLTYSEAIDLLKKKGVDVEWGADFGEAEEAILTGEHDERPLFLTRFPSSAKAFYMQPDPEDQDFALAMDLLAPEGYGEIIGGSQRIHDHDLLLKRLVDYALPVGTFQWYLDLRKYGSFPHSGFGMGIERFVAWMSGVEHLRETIPYPRTSNKIYP